MAVVSRTIKSFFGDESIKVDISQSWKLYDNNIIDKSVSIYNGAILRTGASRDKTAARINWIELGDGPYQLISDEDLIEAERRTGIVSWKLLEILSKYPVVKK